MVPRVDRGLGLAVELDPDKAGVPGVEEGVKGQDVLSSLSNIDKLRQSGLTESYTVNGASLVNLESK